MIIKILTEGGKMQPGPALSQKLGPAGVNMGQVISKVNESTKDFQGLKVPVEIHVNTSTRTFDVKVFSPPVSALIKKELGIETGSGKQISLKAGNASIEQIISVAKTKLPNMLANNLKSAVLSVAGTAVSLGILIENKPAREVVREIMEGKYDKEIKMEKTNTDAEKKKQLSDYFAEVKKAQDKMIAQQKAAEEAAAAAAATAANPAATPAPVAKK
ncbi:MAG: 50S ribosomal protein L11 [Nanoarchaeota archaeon]|nr:50S ribosomal protein L11 [Nanoarchaeota archaeon]